MQYQISRVEKIIGLFIFVVFIIVAAFLIFNIRENRLFKDQISLTTIIDKGYGFGNGTVVKVNGIAVGNVEEIKLNENNSVQLTMSIPHPYYENIHNDAVVEIVEPAVLGGAEINILPGSMNLPQVKNGDSLVSRVNTSVTSKLGGQFDKIDATLQEVRKISENVESITKKIDKGEGSLGKLVNDPGLYDSAKKAIDSALVLEKNLPELSATISETKSAMENVNKISQHVESITGKIDKGDGSLGKLVNDPKLYDTARETVESTRSIVDSIKQTKIYVGVNEDYYHKEGLNIAELHLKVVPRESRYFLLGAAILNASADSKITTDKTGGNHYQVGTEFLVAQKVFDNRLTFRVGLLEGKVGGGIDYGLIPAPEINVKEAKDDPYAKVRDVLLITIEGRDTYDENSFNEHLKKAMLRVKARLNFSQYFHVEIGGSNLLNTPGFYAGIGFEYLDEDISKIVGLVGAGK